MQRGAVSRLEKTERQRSQNHSGTSRLTFPGRLEAVEDVYSLDVIGQRGVGQQGAVPIDCVQGKFEG